MVDSPRRAVSEGLVGARHRVLSFLIIERES